MHQKKGLQSKKKTLKEYLATWGVKWCIYRDVFLLVFVLDSLYVFLSLSFHNSQVGLTFSAKLQEKKCFPSVLFSLIDIYIQGIIRRVLLMLHRDPYFLWSFCHMIKTTKSWIFLCPDADRNNIKGTRCLGSVKLVFEKRLQPFVMKCIWVERCKSRIQWSTQPCLEIARLSFYIVD